MSVEHKSPRCQPAVLRLTDYGNLPNLCFKIWSTNNVAQLGFHRPVSTNLPTGHSDACGHDRRLMTRFNAWLQQPQQVDQFDWVTSFLRQHGQLRLARTIMAVVCGLAAVVPVSDLGFLGLPAAGALTVEAITLAYTLGMLVFWMTRWPTRRQSLLAVMLGVLCIGGWAVAQPDAAYSVLACMPLAVTGGYTAVFHGARVFMVHAVLAVLIATLVMLRLSGQTAVPAASAFWLLNFVIVSVSLGFWGMTRGVRIYAHRSDRDALTGLLNRRALAGALDDCLARRPPAHTHLLVAVVDLDSFKSLNDTRGHAAGDQVLRTVAQLLCEHTPDGTIVCRFGGEEFLIALTAESLDIRSLAAQICRTIAELPVNITASIGTAGAELSALTGLNRRHLLDELTATADQAMYGAKRDGGNRVLHSSLHSAVATAPLSSRDHAGPRLQMAAGQPLIPLPDAAEVAAEDDQTNRS